MANEPPRVLILDDRPAPEVPLARMLTRRGVPAVALHPSELTEALLAPLDLIVLDEYLDEWPERDDSNLSLGLRPRDGLALAGILRSHLDSPPTSGEQPALVVEAPAKAIAFVIRTGDYQRLAAGLPTRSGEHLIAAERDVEWVMSKAEPDETSLRPEPAIRLAAMADAIRSLPSQWPNEASLVDHARSWLALEEQPFAEVAVRHIEDCHPPLHTVARRWAGRSFLRWFLHRILPYPCFLLDATYVAAKLRVRVEDLVLISDSETDLGRALVAARYTGQLAEFDGPRWWRAGIDHLLMDMGGGQWPSSAELSAAIEARHGSAVPAIEPLDPVVVLDSGYQAKRKAVSAQDAVRIQPDSWPPYADDAWVLPADAEDDPALAAVVISADRWRLSPTELSD